MKLLPLFRSSLSSALEIQYLNKKKIGDQTLVTNLPIKYGQEFVTKANINKYIRNIYLYKYSCDHVQMNRIKNKAKK